jgi:L-ascorbate metabolism protein UlaG (beta-lactamase superfamily)
VTDDVSHHLDPSAIAQLRGHGAPVVIPASGLHVIPDGIVMANGDVRELAGVHVRAVPAYDLTAGTPAHPKGQANGDLVTVGGATLFFAGVTECVPELSQLGPIDVAFIPLNIPPNRMTPADAAACVKRIQPKRVYPYHYDQDRASALSRPGGSTRLPAGVSVEESLQHFEEYLSGSGILVRRGAWYPTSPAPAHH